MCLETITSLIKDSIISIVTLITAIVAVIGINKWKKEVKGKKYFDISYKLLKAAYTVRDNFMSARNSFINPFENRNNYNPLLDDIDVQFENEKYVLNNRFKVLYTSSLELESLKIEAEVLWGKEVRDLCDEIKRQLVIYQRRLDEYFQLKNKTNNEEHFLKISNCIYAKYKNDEIDNKINEIIKKLENKVKEFLK